MTARTSIDGTDSLLDEETGMPRRFTAAIYERERAETKLREALAREVVLVDALSRNEAMVRQMGETNRRLAAWHEAAAARIACLTPREGEVMEMVLAGVPSKNIAADLGISQRTVENHRAAIMRRTGAKCLAALARLALAAAWSDVPDHSP